MEFSSKIKKLRTAKGLTQKQIADCLNVSQNAVYNWENGKREPNMDMQKKIAKFFDFPLYLLLDDNYELENVELEMQRARPFGASEMTKPPENKPFTRPLSSLKAGSNLDDMNREQREGIRFVNLMQKVANGKDLTQEELKFKTTYFEKALRKLCDVFAKVYITLNTEGQEKAENAIDRAVEQLELLAKIPEYQREPPEPPEE